jgi:hypothetical protein
MRPETRFSTGEYASILVSAFARSGESLANKMVEPLLEGQYGDGASWMVFSMAAKIAIAKKLNGAAVWLYRLALALPKNELTREDRKQIYLYLISLSPDLLLHDFDGDFLETIWLQPVADFDERDVRIFYELIKKNIDARHLYRAKKLLKVVAQLRTAAETSNRGESSDSSWIFVPLDFLELRLLMIENDPLALQYKAASIKCRLDSGPFTLQYFSSGFIEAVKSTVRDLLDRFE